MSIQEVRERVQALSKELNRQLAESPKGSIWTAAQQADFDAKADEVDRGNKMIASMQRVIDQAAEDSFSDAVRDTVEAPKQKPLAMQGFEIFLRKKVEQMTPEELHKFRNTMSTTTGSQGGYGVMPLVATTLIDLLKSYGYMRKVADQITTANGADLSYPSSDGTSELGEIVAQNGTASAADPTFGTVPVNTVKFSSKIVAIPVELIQDAQFDIVAMVMKRLRDRLGRTQNQKFTIGTGTAEPWGLVAASGTGKVGTTGQTLTIIYDDLVDMVDSLDAAYLDEPESDPQMNAPAPGWMFSQTMRRVVRKIKDTAGRPIWTPSYDEGMASKTPDRLLGYPVNINNDMAVPAANAKSLAFGNFHKYLIRDAMDVTIQRYDDSVYASKGQVAFLAWARAGGNLLDVNSVKVYQHSAT